MQALMHRAAYRMAWIQRRSLQLVQSVLVWKVRLHIQHWIYCRKHETDILLHKMHEHDFPAPRPVSYYPRYHATLGIQLARADDSWDRLIDREQWTENWKPETDKYQTDKTEQRNNIYSSILAKVTARCLRLPLSSPLRWYVVLLIALFTINLLINLWLCG